MQSQGTPTSDGIEFGPNDSGKPYISLNAHRGSRPHKSKWRTEVTPPMEYGIFCDADGNEWNDNSGHYWGVLNRGDTVLGMVGERLSKFPCTSNDNDPWHGYPVNPAKVTEMLHPTTSCLTGLRLM